MADEWNGSANLGGIKLYFILGALWDYTRIYEIKIETGKSTAPSNSSVGILTGNNFAGLSFNLRFENIEILQN